MCVGVCVCVCALNIYVRAHTRALACTHYVRSAFWLKSALLRPLARPLPARPQYHSAMSSNGRTRPPIGAKLPAGSLRVLVPKYTDWVHPPQERRQRSEYNAVCAASKVSGNDAGGAQSSGAIRAAVLETAVAANNARNDADDAQTRLTVAKAYQPFDDGPSLDRLPADATDETRRVLKRRLEKKRDVVQAALQEPETLPEPERDAKKRLTWLKTRVDEEDSLLNIVCKRQRIDANRQSKIAVAAPATREYPPTVIEKRRAKQPPKRSEAGAPGAPRPNRDISSRYGNSNGSPPTGHPPTRQPPTGNIDVYTLLSPHTRSGTVPCDQQTVTQDDTRLRRAIDDQIRMASKDRVRDKQSDIEAREASHRPETAVAPDAEQHSASGELDSVVVLVDSESGTDGDSAESTAQRREVGKGSCKLKPKQPNCPSPQFFLEAFMPSPVSALPQLFLVNYLSGRCHCAVLASQDLDVRKRIEYTQEDGTMVWLKAACSTNLGHCTVQLSPQEGIQMCTRSGCAVLM